MRCLGLPISFRQLGAPSLQSFSVAIGTLIGLITLSVADVLTTMKMSIHSMCCSLAVTVRPAAFLAETNRPYRERAQLEGPRSVARGKH
jgi:hypothetical protein